MLGLTQLDAILTQPLRALSAAPRRSSPPQRSLRDSITWSYELCDPEERLAWEALSVFAGSFDLAAASAVLRQVADREPVELIEALVARSILTTTPEGATRYRMLVVLREYGREQLRVRGVEQQVREAHAGWYAHIGAELEANWVGPGQGERLRHAEIELPNIREAAQFALAADRPELLAGLVVQPAAQLWWTTGRLDEGLYWLRRVLAVHHRPDAVRIHALIQASTFALVLGALDEGEALARELADRARGSGDAFWLGATAFVEGFAAIQRRDYRAAVDILRGGVRIGDGHDDLLRMRLRNRQMLAFALNAVRRDAEAAQVCDEILTLGTAAGDAYYCAFANQLHALYAWRNNDPRAARSRATSALKTSLDFPNRPENVDLLLICALIEERWGDRTRAAALLAAADATDRVGLRPATLGAQDVAAAASHLASLPDTESARALGRTLSAREALELALGGRPALTHEPELTPREAAIARLITRGMANKQIAAELGLSPKTIEGHVTRIMAKLGARSRVQIATWVARGDAQPASGQSSMR